jgi:peptide/nickel transport system permease protein
MRLSPKPLVGLLIIVSVSFAAIGAPFLAPHDPIATGLFQLEPPSASHWFGTDELGRDIFARVLYGARISLVVGIGAATVAMLLGVPLGLVAGYRGGVVDLLAVQLIDLFIALPGLVLALIITAMVGPSLRNLVLILGFVMWPAVARLVRGQALAIRETVFVEAARSVGGGTAWIVRRHIWPNVARIAAAQFAVSVAFAIFTSASLSFLGLGVPPPAPDWGGMVRTGFDFLVVNPAMSLAPGAAVSLTVAGFYFLGSRAGEE